MRAHSSGWTAAAGLGATCAVLLFIAGSWPAQQQKPSELLEYFELPRGQMLVQQQQMQQQQQPADFLVPDELLPKDFAKKHKQEKPLSFKSLKDQPNVFVGHMLCAEGEKTCEHPCSAFNTITETESDCKCKCTVNPLSYAKDDVICTCPDAPISYENDLYPFAEGERPAPVVEDEDEDAEDASVPEADDSTDVSSATDEDAVAPVTEEVGATTTDEGSVLPPETGSTAVTRGFGPVGLAAQRTRMARMALEQQRVNRMALQQQRAHMLQQSMGGGGNWGFQQQNTFQQANAFQQPNTRMYAPAPFLPPDGDYPGGSTGIPMDGYIAFDTGYGEQPYHGMYAPMQEAGIANSVKGRGMLRGASAPHHAGKEAGAVLPPGV